MAWNHKLYEAAKRAMKDGATLQEAGNLCLKSTSAVFSLAKAEKWQRARKWTPPEKIKAVQQLHDEGKNTREIGRLLKLSKGAVHRAIRKKSDARKFTR